MRAVVLAAAVAVAGGALAGAAPPPLGERPVVEFGYIRALTRQASGYNLRFDLTLRLSGKTAIDACIDNDGCARSTGGFPDDVYYRDLHYVLTYRVPPDARVTLVGANPRLSPEITPRELYDLAHGRNPRHRRLQDPRLRQLGFYIEVVPSGLWTRLDSATRLEQVYQP